METTNIEITFNSPLIQMYRGRLPINGNTGGIISSRGNILLLCLFLFAPHFPHHVHFKVILQIVKTIFRCFMLGQGLTMQKNGVKLSLYLKDLLLIFDTSLDEFNDFVSIKVYLKVQSDQRSV